MRVAIVHHWFVTRGGGERVAECIASLFPDAEIFTLVASKVGLPASLAGRKLHTSFLQRLPLARTFHRHMMPLYPWAVEGLDLRGFDLVISSDSGPAKGVRVDTGAVHLCYCHSPMRYLYDGYDAYRGQMGWLTRAIFTLTAARVREWDLKAARHVTAFIANSEYVAARILRYYGRGSQVIHPPIDLHRARQIEMEQDPNSLPRVENRAYLCAGRLVGYKRTELMIEACERLGRRLRIVGTGPEEARLRKLAGPQTTFLGELATAELWQEYAACRALLFAADEDFGMVPLEAQACGRPVIAYGAGGSLETVCGLVVCGPVVFGPVQHGLAEEGSTGEYATGVYFYEQTVESVMQGILECEAAEAAGRFVPSVIKHWAARFDLSVFLKQFREFVRARVPGVESAMVTEGEQAVQAGR